MPLDLHPADITDLADTLAELIMERLGGSVVSSAIPAAVGEWLRDSCKWGDIRYRCGVPLYGPNQLMLDCQIHADGTLTLEMQDSNAQAFWRGTFRPADEKGSKDAS